MIDPGYILDSNICVYLLDGRSDCARNHVQSHQFGRVATSSIVFGEVMIGARRRNAVQAALAFFDIVHVLPFDRNAAEVYSQLPFRRGKFDRLIAAHALSLDLTLITNNETDYADIAGLKIENWTLS